LPVNASQHAAFANGQYSDLLIEDSGKKANQNTWPVTLLSSE
jgi:hypothetical protein